MLKISTPNVVLISIPHTGTWFTIRLLTEAGLGECGLLDRASRPSVYHGHMVKRGQVEKALELSERMPLVIPMRHPFRVERSWVLREKPTGPMFAAFRTFLRDFWPLRPYLMPVDSPRRVEALGRLGDGLGLELSTDWSVVNGAMNTHDVQLDDLLPSESVVELAEEMRPILAEYY